MKWFVYTIVVVGFLLAIAVIEVQLAQYLHHESLAGRAFIYLYFMFGGSPCNPGTQVCF